MVKLTGADRKYLRGLAQPLKSVVQVGKAGVTQGLIGTVTRALDTHELIKVRFVEFKKEKRELSKEIAQRTRCEIAGMIGHIVILYREQPDEEKRRIRLPRRTP